MKVVVTGGSGQLGSLVLEHLARSRGIKRIVSLDLVPPRIASPKLDYRIADMRDPGLERHLEGADALVHLAFVVAGARSLEAMRSVNVDGTRRVLEAAEMHGIRRIVYASSIAAYGVVAGQPDPIIESTPRRRTGTLPYADHKYEVEDLLDRHEEAHPEVSVVRLRPGVLLGRRISHVPERFVRRRIWPMLSNVRIPVVWDEDVADACLLALREGVRGPFNLVASDALTGRELARLAGFRPLSVRPAVARRLLGLLGTAGSPRADAGWIDAGAVELSVSAERARSELGWTPRHPTARDVATAFGRQARRSPDARLALFMRLVGPVTHPAEDLVPVRGDSKARDLTVHLDVTGPRGGDFTLRLAQGKLVVSRGIPRPPDAAVLVDVDAFLRVLGGAESPSTSAMTGRIRVRGEPDALLVVSGIVQAFRSATRRRGVSGSLARGFDRWLGKEAAS